MRPVADSIHLLIGDSTQEISLVARAVVELGERPVAMVAVTRRRQVTLPVRRSMEVELANIFCNESDSLPDV